MGEKLLGHQFSVHLWGVSVSGGLSAILLTEK